MSNYNGPKNSYCGVETTEWRRNFEQFVDDRVFELNPSTYEKALENLKNLSKKPLAAIHESKANR